MPFFYMLTATLVRHNVLLQNFYNRQQRRCLTASFVLNTTQFLNEIHTQRPLKVEGIETLVFYLVVLFWKFCAYAVVLGLGGFFFFLYFVLFLPLLTMLFPSADHKLWLLLPVYQLIFGQWGQFKVVSLHFFFDMKSVYLSLSLSLTLRHTRAPWGCI